MKTKPIHPYKQTALALWAVAGLLGLQLNAGEMAAWLGVSVGTVADAVRHQLKLPRGAGLTVENVAENSPAATAGVERHDVLQKVDDQWLFNADQLTRLIRSYEPGVTVSLMVLRGGKPETLSAELAEQEVPPAPSWSYGVPMTGFGGGGSKGGSPFGAGGMGAPGMGGMGGPRGTGGGGGGGYGGYGGMGGGSFGGGTGFARPQITNLLQNLEAARVHASGWTASSQPTAYLGVELRAPDETLLEQLDRSREDGGVLIEEVMDDSPAAKSGLVKHDLIIELDSKNVADPRQFADIIGRWKPGDRVALKLLREGKPVEIEVKLGQRKPADPARFQQLHRQFMVAPRIEMNTLPNQSGSVIIMKDTAGTADPFGGSSGAGGGYGMGGGMGGPLVNEVEVHATVQGNKTVQTHVGTVVSRDPAGEIAVRQQGESRHVTVKDADGKVLFDGEVNSETDRRKLSPEVRKRLEKVEHLLQENLTHPTAPPAERQLHLFHEETKPGFIRHEEEEVLMPEGPTGV